MQQTGESVASVVARPCYCSIPILVLLPLPIHKPSCLQNNRTKQSQSLEPLLHAFALSIILLSIKHAVCLVYNKEYI